MIPRELIGTAQVPGGEELRLYRHDRDFMIVLDRNELMSSRLSGSEIALAVPLRCFRAPMFAARSAACATPSIR